MMFCVLYSFHAWSALTFNQEVHVLDAVSGAGILIKE